MADIGSTATFVVYITLSNNSGDLPDNGDVEDMVFHQMGGELDENGLICLAVSVAGITGD